jgi:hypothetical protein
VLVQVKNKRERSMPEWPPRSGETSRLGSRDPVADGIKCGPYGARTSRATWTVVKPVAWWRPIQGTRQDQVDRPGAGGERFGELDAWRGGCAVHAGFGGLATKPSGGGFLGLGLKTKSEDSTRQVGCPGRSDRPIQAV